MTQFALLSTLKGCISATQRSKPRSLLILAGGEVKRPQLLFVFRFTFRSMGIFFVKVCPIQPPSLLSFLGGGGGHWELRTPDFRFNVNPGLITPG